MAGVRWLACGLGGFQSPICPQGHWVEGCGEETGKQSQVEGQ